MATDLSLYLGGMPDEQLRELQDHVAERVNAYRLRIELDGPDPDVSANLAAYEDLLVGVDQEIDQRPGLS